MFSRELFSERLRMIRTSNHLTQTQLAELIEVNRTMITLLEKGVRSPSIEVSCAIADILNVSLDYLVGLSDQPNR